MIENRFDINVFNKVNSVQESFVVLILLTNYLVQFTEEFVGKIILVEVKRGHGHSANPAYHFPLVYAKILALSETLN